MAYIQNNLWADASNYGSGLAQTLTQALLQVPAQRTEMLMRLAELQRQNAIAQQMGGYRQALLGLQAQRVNDQDRWHQDVLNQRIQYENAMGQIRGLQAQNQAQMNAIRQQQAQAALQKLIAPRIEGGQLIQGQMVPQGMPPGSQGPTQQQAGLLPPTAVQWNVSPAPQTQQQLPSTMLNSIGNLTRDYMGGVGSTNPAVADFARTNVLPLLLQLQGRAQGQGQGQATQQQLQGLPSQPATSGATNRFRWDPNSFTLTPY
ncbi:MAG: hypothetical protein KGL39_08660 [Patescibacteria group bacterium]|nr:hypothetical protein [Patescibacteria group bacterium]